MSSNVSVNNNRIAKNTLLLYFRMFLTMMVSFYTSRVVLNILGIEDFGIYNVVAGVIAMLGFINGSLSGASSRFLTFELGSGNIECLTRMFSTILYIHFILALIVVLLGETIGLWFVCNKLVIPLERMDAALWVYHCSIVIMAINILSVPYNSLIIAHEKMNVFAYISIVEVLLKLLIVYLLLCIPYDKLIIYAFLYLLVQLLIRIMYNYYCIKHFKESKTKPKYNSKQMKDIFIYALWTINGNLAVVGYTQGLNMLLNIFFGPVVNAARGISVQVQNAVMTFVQNFQTAIRPQVIKSYANKNYEYMHSLIVASSKYGFYLMQIVTFPILLCIDPILNIWLGIVPEYTSDFIRLMLFTGLLQPLSSSLIIGIHATGDIRKFQLIEGTALLMIVPISYLLLKLFSITPICVMLVYFCVEFLTQILRVWIILPKIGMKYTKYLKEAIIPILLPFVIMTVILFVIDISLKLSLIFIIVYSFLACLFIMICIYIVGLNKFERMILQQYIKKRKKNVVS